MSELSTDRIEKRVVLRAPRARVWRAIADSQEFGTWFRMQFDGPFVEGRSVRGRVLYPGYEHITGEFMIERVEPEHTFAYRWHPYAVDMSMDYS
ncbi:MAG: SRPBCC domain-containing protein, partial [Acidobacteriota bacterium]|nr:SRPBCC domain-containing protein [Acidobacteriota bacterium]